MSDNDLEIASLTGAIVRTQILIDHIKEQLEESRRNIVALEEELSWLEGSLKELEKNRDRRIGL